MDELKGRIREFVCNHLKQRAGQMNVTITTFDDSADMLASGLLDSMGFVDLMVSVESEFDVQFDFGDRDPSEFTTLSGFVNSAQKP
jgi:acyl carrier protein